MENPFNNHREVWKKPGFAFSVLSGFLFLFASLIINYAAGTYAVEKASNPVTDLILDNTPKLNVEFIFVYGFFILISFIALLLLNDPRRIPFVLKSSALFIFVRSIFIILTHIGPFPDNDFVDYAAVIKKFTFGADLFFSGHTGFPFLMALIYWEKKILRNIFIAVSLIFGAAVLLGHLHYSIDVFAAFFITEGTFRIAEKLFKKDHI